MKKSLLPCIVSMLALSAMAQDIQLPSPDLGQQTLTVVDALNTRHSVRSFDATKSLMPQQLSNLCWAACGITRGGNFRTAPSAMNRQEIRLFAFTCEGVYEYEAKANLLVRKASGDQRQLMAGNSPDSEMKQTFVMDAPIVLLMVIDFERFGGNDGRAMMMGCVDAGNVSENINLYCQAAGLATVPRATHDAAGIRRLLGLTERQLPIMNNPVGYAK
ncbi:MAG: nitroreductase family protein [Bacteroidales bacterium]|nr:nitroreductase family protein [Bacteroidales bacterium]